MSIGSLELSSYRDQHFKVPSIIFHLNSIQKHTNFYNLISNLKKGITPRTRQIAKTYKHPLRWQFIILHDRRTNS